MPALARFVACYALAGLFFDSCTAAYTLKDDYSGQKFFSMFDFFTENDPTKGYVDYISQSAAQSANLISTSNGQAYMGVDYQNIASGRGRKSVRLTSKAAYNHGLIILDLEHMPGSICGAWPAFWTVGPDWPNSGEIDIIEGVNAQTHNAMTLHTGPGCSIGGSTPSPNGPQGGTGATGATGAQAAFSGSVATSNCDINAPGQATNAGCSIATADKSSYGDGLNAIGGGVYATEWNSNVIRVWYFRRGSIPADIDSGSPSPNSWGTPLASFSSSSCDIDDNFKNQQIVFDTTFCGVWAGQVWSTDATCSKKAATCEDFVKNNPEAFKEAYWTVNDLKVYTGSDDGKSPVGPPRPDTNATASGIAKPTGSHTRQPPVGTYPGSSQTGPRPTASAPGRPGNGANTFVSSAPIQPQPTAQPAPDLPTTVFMTSTTSITQTVQNPEDGQPPWRGEHTRTRGRGHWNDDNGGLGYGQRKWKANLGRDVDVPEATTAPVVTSGQEGGEVERQEPLRRTLLGPTVRRDYVPDDSDAKTRRRHLARHLGASGAHRRGHDGI